MSSLGLLLARTTPKLPMPFEDARPPSYPGTRRQVFPPWTGRFSISTAIGLDATRRRVN
jgi:hypothetical protein